MSQKIIVANWKMNLNPAEAEQLVERLDGAIKASDNAVVILCPPFIDLTSLANVIDHHKFSLGAQNLHYLDEGPYTGEVSPAMLSGLVDYSIIGHSERRLYADEDDRLIAKKVGAALRHSIKPVLCVGETLLDREHGGSRKVVIDQLTADLHMATEKDIRNTIVTYEPVWAISTGDGKGKHATPDEVAPMVAAIRETVAELYTDETAADLRVLYGGSVNPDDCRAYLAMDGVDGLLVGGASLNYEQFAAIVTAAQEAA